MAGFNFDDLKDKVSSAFRHGESETDENQYADAAYEDDYENNAFSEDGQYDDGQYDDGQYDDSQYDDGQYDDGQYDDSQYDDGQYDDGQYDDGQYDDGQYDNGQYDDGQYDDGQYDDGQYDEGYIDDGYAGAYDEPEDAQDSKSLGYNPAIFQNLDSEDGYADDGYTDDAYNEEGYEDGGYEDNGEGYETEPVGGFLGYVTQNDWVMYAALVLLPPLGVWLLWRKNKFDITLRTTLSAASLIWFIIILIWLFTRGGGTDDPVQTNPNFNVFTSSAPTEAIQPTATAMPTEPAEPVVTPRVDNTGNNNPPSTESTATNDGNASVSYVYVTNAGKYYHTIPDCGGITNASKVALDAAIARALTACPDCAGGTNNFTTGNVITNLYATKNGTWYHSDPSCQSMTGASVVTESNAIAAGKTACPVCIGYYGTPGGSWYHSISNCQKMSNAITKTKEEWIANGKTACPVCIKDGKGTAVAQSNSTPTQTMVYATANGTYYHTKSDCSGMKGATYGSIASAVSMGKKSCPKCVSTSTLQVFSTTTGTWFHTKANCKGMKNAQYVTLKTALGYKKTACPECANMLSGYSGSGSTASNPADNPTSANDKATYVYMTTNGKYLHLDSSCSGMTTAQRVTYAKAIKAGKYICPTCVSAKALTVFATTGGKYYHTNATCSGMKDAVAVSAEKALSAGKIACTSCAKALKSVLKASATASPSAVPTVKTKETDTRVYATTDGKYFHVEIKCSGMSGAKEITYKQAVNAGKKPCPTCIKPKYLTVFATSSGKYYHTNSTCSGMKDAVAVTASTAISYGKTPCPTCAKALGSVGATPTATPAPTAAVPTVKTTDTATYVYATKDGKYYHVEIKCGGMSGARKITYAEAINEGKKICPTCVKPKYLTVFATADGHYFHTNSTCSGMKNALAVKASTAISYGKIACRTCALDLRTDITTAAPTVAPTAKPTSKNETTAKPTQNSGSSDSSIVYIKPGTSNYYYHKSSRCSDQSISGMQNVTVEYAKAHGYKSCPDCKP